MKTIFFIMFFSVGAASLGVSVLCEDLIRYYQNRQLVYAAQESLERLKSLNTDYDVVLNTLEEDPNSIRRIAPAAIGIEYQDANAINPRIEAEQLAAARKALTDPNKSTGGHSAKESPGLSQQAAETVVLGTTYGEPAIPRWLSRCSEPAKRTVIFFSGMALILISFVCFGSVKKAN